jgi:hypothetical protein
VANPKLDGLVDAFAGPTLNTALWNASSLTGVTLDTALNRVAVSCTTNYYSLASTLWDATGRSIYARVTPTPPGNGSTQTFLEVLFDANNKATMSVSGGAFTVSTTNAGTATTTTVAANWAAYDPFNYAWWRITEVSGSFVFATSPDAYTWTTRATIAYTWNATAVKVQFVTGYYATETAGMSAYIDHVNTTSSAPGQQNLNWPGLEVAWAPYWNCNGGDVSLDRYVEVTSRTRGQTSVQRGRQYELDQVRSGELRAQLVNRDGSLDPNNASGPWYGHIQPYQPTRVRAQWPPTRNLLDQVMATGGDLGGYALGTIPGGSAGADIFSVTDSTGGSFVSSASAWQGSTVMQFAVPSGSASASRVCHTPRWSVIPGQTYSVTLQVRDVTAATSLQVQAFLGWYTIGTGTPTSFTYGTASTLTGSTTAGWTAITVTATAPANAAGIDCGVALAATAAATCSVQVDGWQLEKGAASTTWTCPGVTYPVFGGFVERWPSSWTMNGTYGTVQPTAVDALSLLSQVVLQDPLTEEINSHSPRFLYTLGDPQGATSFTDATGQNRAASIAVGKYGAGSLTSGNQITSASAGGSYTGSSNTVVTISNSNPGTNLTSGGATCISLNAAGITGPANPSGSWTRMFAFRYTGPTPTSLAVLWSCFSRNSSTGSRMYFQIGSDGKLALAMAGPTTGGTAIIFVPGATVADSNWHLAIASYSHANATLIVSVDGASTTWPSFDPTLEPTGLISDNVGGWVDPTVGNGTTFNFKGDMSFVAEFPSALSSTDITNLYNAWKSSCSGESTDARYNRILRYAAFTGPSSVQAGLTTSMGPAQLAGQDALSALQSVVDTENGEHFVARDGTLTFKSRSARYNALTPAVIFGENAAAGEIPYEDAQLDYDPTHLSNLVTITQASTNQTFVAQDATSQTNYFPRSLTRTINSSSALECQDAANYMLSRYKTALTRVQLLKVHVSANPALWPTLLSLELGTRVRVMRRPPSPAPTIQVECYAEAIQWDWDDHGEAFMTLQCSPADSTPYAIFAAFHTTLNGSPAAGVTSITINAGADNTNLAAAQLGPGQQLVLGLNTANQETVTIKAVGATSPGWTTATITLTAATTKSHTNGDTVCEPLPSGVTDPTVYDNSAKFDSIAFAY